MIRVLVVDDSAFMRNMITKFLTSNHEIAVAGTARNGEEALQKIKELRPDVITLDIEMPVMNGKETLKRIMASDPLPVVMVSSLTQQGLISRSNVLSWGRSISSQSRRVQFQLIYIK